VDLREPTSKGKEGRGSERGRERRDKEWRREGRGWTEGKERGGMLSTSKGRETRKGRRWEEKGEWRGRDGLTMVPTTDSSHRLWVRNVWVRILMGGSRGR